MGADFSRVRLDPLLDYAGVELKQGGVLLDADANELVAIFDRRLRALASDTLGRARVSSTTPDAFKITSAAGTLQIGRGRLYVDGLLAECHGASDPAKREFDPVLAETRFTDSVDFEKQPYVPTPQALPTTGQHLVYLDVWDREVTNLAQPDLVETAVGVETSSRVQTVWQVRLLSKGVDSQTACGSDLIDWDELVAPSTGRLTTGTYEIPPADDPCELPPSGGYRGLENQLYRVEIHKGGKPGSGATFKWSRENASVGSRVATMVSATELELESLGRDDVLRFKTGDWVEIINDAREFSQMPGDIRQITVTEANKRISFSGALASDLQPQPANFPNSKFADDSNLHVIRWDQGGKVYKTNTSGPPIQVQDLDAGGSTGLIDMPAAGVKLLLENGITVSFNSVGPKGFKPGDYWVFAARSADASVEILDEAPPRGIHHHFARLGIWNVGSGVTDCRSPWPPATGDCDCACTLCVTPKSHADKSLTIQDAVDKLRDTGGTICLTVGGYPLTEPVRISGPKSIRITGQGAATVIGTGGTALRIENSEGTTIDSLTVFSLMLKSAISVRSAVGLTLHHLSIVTDLNNLNPDAHGAAIALSGVVKGANIHDNLLAAPDGVRALELENEEDKAPTFLATAGMAIDSNVFFYCRDTAIKFDGQVGHWFDTRVIGNQILGGREIGISFAGFAFPGSSVRIIENNLQPFGPGIRCSTGNLWVESNKIQGASDKERKLNGPGIQLTGGFFKVGIDQAQLLANQISLFPDAGIMVDAAVSDLIIKLNIIENCRAGIVLTGTAQAESVSIDNNQLRDIGQPTGIVADGNMIVGIGLMRTEAATIAGNILRRIGTKADGSTGTIAGISAQSVTRVRIIGNEVAEVGPEEFGGEIAGIAVSAPYQQAEVANNHVDRDAELNRPPSSTAWYALNIRQPISGKNFVSTFGKFMSIALDETRMLSVSAGNAWVTTAAASVDPASGRSVAPPGASALVLGNSLVARGGVQAVDISATGDVLFSDNRCELRQNGSIDAVQIATPVAVVNANRVRGGESSIQLSLGNTKVTAIGNITTGSIGPNVPAPMTPLNLIG